MTKLAYAAVNEGYDLSSQELASEARYLQEAGGFTPYTWSDLVDKAGQKLIEARGTITEPYYKMREAWEAEFRQEIEAGEVVITWPPRLQPPPDYDFFADLGIGEPLSALRTRLCPPNTKTRSNGQFTMSDLKRPIDAACKHIT